MALVRRGFRLSQSFSAPGALMLAVAAAPAEAKKMRKPVGKPTEETIPDPTNGEPLTIVASLSKQKLDVYLGTMLIASSEASTGMPGYDTNAGVFSILEKQRYHESNLSCGAPMPWMPIYIDLSRFT